MHFEQEGNIAQQRGCLGAGWEMSSWGLDQGQTAGQKAGARIHI